MFPGLTTKLSESAFASATTIFPKTDLVRLTGTTAIATIRPNFGGGFGGILVIVPTADTATVTTGNIAIAVTMPANRATVLVFSKLTGTWYPGAIS